MKDERTHKRREINIHDPAYYTRLATLAWRRDGTRLLYCKPNSV